MHGPSVQLHIRAVLGMLIPKIAATVTLSGSATQVALRRETSEESLWGKMLRWCPAVTAVGWDNPLSTTDWDFLAYPHAAWRHSHNQDGFVKALAEVPGVRHPDPAAPDTGSDPGCAPSSPTPPPLRPPACAAGHPAGPRRHRSCASGDCSRFRTAAWSGRRS